MAACKRGPPSSTSASTSGLSRSVLPRRLWRVVGWVGFLSDVIGGVESALWEGCYPALTLAHGVCVIVYVWFLSAGSGAVWEGGSSLHSGIEFGRSRTGEGSSEEGGGVRSGPGAARTILLFHTISASPPKQPRMVRTFLKVHTRSRLAYALRCRGY